MEKPLHQRRKALGSNDNQSNGYLVGGGGVTTIIPASATSTRRPRRSAGGRPAAAASGPLLIFRLFIIAIIVFCLAWGYLLIRIALELESSSSGDGSRPSSPLMLARPHVLLGDEATATTGVGGARSRISGMIRREMDRVEARMNPAPMIDAKRMDSPLLIICYDRADYLERTLWRVLEHHPAGPEAAAAAGTTTARRDNNDGGTRGGGGGASFQRRQLSSGGRIAGAPIIISQDGSNAEVKAVIDAYRQLFELKLGVPLYRIEHPRAIIDLTDTDWEEWKIPYQMLARHYGWALEEAFSGGAYDEDRHYQKHARKNMPAPPPPRRVIVLEEDVEIASDFFSLMNATAGLLDADDTLLAVSAFNDNGKERFVSDAKRLVRSDFFPGLGWMMARGAWDGSRPESVASVRPDDESGLRVAWAPDGFWDDWLRDPARRQGRQVIRPEVSRTFHFGNIHGVSEGQYNGVLNQIELGEGGDGVRWEEDIDLSSLDSARFASMYWGRVSRARPVDEAAEAKSYVANGDVRMTYSNFDQFRRLASEFEVMEDEKAGVPRTAYEGIVEIRYGRGDFFVYLTPPYVDKSSIMPGHFGKKAWMEYTKESLMKELGIEDVPIFNQTFLDDFSPDGQNGWD